jgi:hypothetical protein
MRFGFGFMRFVRRLTPAFVPEIRTPCPYHLRIATHTVVRVRSMSHSVPYTLRSGGVSRPTWPHPSRSFVCKMVLISTLSPRTSGRAEATFGLVSLHQKECTISATGLCSHTVYITAYLGSETSIERDRGFKPHGSSYQAVLYLLRSGYVPGGGHVCRSHARRLDVKPLSDQP